MKKNLKIYAIKSTLESAAYFFKVHLNSLTSLVDFVDENEMDIWDKPYDETHTMETALELAVKGIISSKDWTDRLEEIWNEKRR